MSYKSPHMKIPEIVTALREIGLNVTENDFRKPVPKRWREFYAKMFENLTNISIEMAIQNVCQFSQIKLIHPELVEEGFSQMAFTLCMQRVLCSCGYEQFSVKDVIEPNPKMLVRMGSAFVNTCRHNSTRKNYFYDLRDEIEWSKGEFDKILNKNKEMNEQLAKLKETNQEKETEIAQGKEEEEKLKAQLEELQREPFLRDIEEIKHGIAEKNAYREKRKQMNLEIQEECEKLSNKIVSSPERFKQDQDRLGNKVQQLKAHCEAKTKKGMQEKALLDLSASKRIAVEKLVKVMNELQADVRLARQGNEEVNHLVEKAHELREQNLSYHAQKEDLEEEMAVRQSQKQKILTVSDLNKQCGEQNLANGIQQCEFSERQLEILRSDIATLENEKVDIKETLRSEEKDFDIKRADLETEFPSLYEEMDMLHYLASSGLENLKRLMIHSD